MDKKVTYAEAILAEAIAGIGTATRVLTAGNRSGGVAVAGRRPASPERPLQRRSRR